MTPYVILQQDEASELVWAVVSKETASSPERAIRASGLEDNGVYIAVPARSWKPLTVKTEQVTKVTIG